MMMGGFDGSCAEWEYKFWQPSGFVYEANLNIFMISALRGYQWRWRALNIQAGIGLIIFFDKDFVLKSSSGDK